VSHANSVASVRSKTTSRWRLPGVQHRSTATTARSNHSAPSRCVRASVNKASCGYCVEFETKIAGSQSAHGEPDGVIGGQCVGDPRLTGNQQLGAGRSTASGPKLSGCGSQVLSPVPNP
jgi:hypothetical protein